MPLAQPAPLRHAQRMSDLDIRSFGATPADPGAVTSAAAATAAASTASTAFAASAASTTAAINTAITACAKAGGGRVRIPPGRWISSTLHLQSGVT